MHYPPEGYKFDWHVTTHTPFSKSKLLLHDEQIRLVEQVGHEGQATHKYCGLFPVPAGQES